MTQFVVSKSGKKQHILKELGVTYCMVAPNPKFRQTMHNLDFDNAAVSETIDLHVELCASCERLGPVPVEYQRRYWRM